MTLDAIGSSISFGAGSEFNAAPTGDVSASALSSTRFVVAYSDYGNSGYGTAVIGDAPGYLIWVEPGSSGGGNLPCYTTIFDGIEAAGTTATVCVGAGSYDENIVIGANVTVEICWDADFSTMSHPDPVVLNGSGL